MESFGLTCEDGRDMDFHRLEIISVRARGGLGDCIPTELVKAIFWAEASS